MSDEQAFIKALEGKEIPILTLDLRWHQAFSQGKANPEITKLEDEVNDFLKQQGKLNTEVKNVKNLKKQMMDEIVDLTDAFQDTKDTSVEKEIGEKKRLVDECNEKLEEYKDELLDLPIRLKEANLRLMLASMEACKERFGTNEEKITEIERWIRAIKVELKQNIIKKQESEVENYNMYVFMKEFFRDDTLSLFEMGYDPTVNPPKMGNK